MKKTLGIIGCGNIGTIIVRSYEKQLSDVVSKINLFDIDNIKMTALSKEAACSVAAQDMEELIMHSDIVVEAVSPRLVPEVLELCIKHSKDILVMSVGGILECEELIELARHKHINVILPSGAIAGIDAVKTAKISGIENVTITTRKPPKSLKGVAYLEQKGIDIDLIKKETVIFEGTAREAIKIFPQNINVSVILSLAGIGPDKTKVRIITSPEFTGNSHEIQVKAASGTITTIADNVQSPDNPKTSYLAGLSAVAALKQYCDPIKIGT
ncbi:MAG: DUF108 domain-containing protein [Candidatus Omnitrophica bacterium]|nr:DUF108 domain-containing protein [Candidatus Omnitrophota bacterium]